MYLFPPSSSLCESNRLRLQQLLDLLDLSGYPAQAWPCPSETLRPSFLLCAGGDGTLLEALPAALKTQQTLVGLGMGRFNFLRAPDVDQPDVFIPKLLARAYTPSHHHLIEWNDLNPDTPRSGYVLNDVVLHRGESQRLLQISVLVDGNPYQTLDGDGILISTPTGSTAYNLSLGGPIVMPTADVMIITPIAPHRIASRSLILPKHCLITLEVKGQHLLQADRQRYRIQESANYQFQLSNQRVSLITRPFIHSVGKEL